MSTPHRVVTNRINPAPDAGVSFLLPQPLASATAQLDVIRATVIDLPVERQDTTPSQFIYHLVTTYIDLGMVEFVVLPIEHVVKRMLPAIPVSLVFFDLIDRRFTEPIFGIRLEMPGVVGEGNVGFLLTFVRMCLTPSALLPLAHAITLLIGHGLPWCSGQWQMLFIQP